MKRSITSMGRLAPTSKAEVLLSQAMDQWESGKVAR